MKPDITNEIKLKIKKKIHKFDLISLLKLLFYYGYKQNEILFRSNMSTCSQPGIIYDIKFIESPDWSIEIAVNIGLLSAQSPLPSYFQKSLDEKGGNQQEFEDFIGYFDNFLIWNYVLNLYPELNKKYYKDWNKNIRTYLQLLDLKSTSTLFWLFQLVFPELKTQVKKITMQRGLIVAPIIMGKSVLGSDAVFGQKTGAPVYGLEVTLFSEDEIANAGVPWPKEIRNRLKDQVFPLLKPEDVNLEICLVIRSQKRWLQFSEESYLGYDRMKGGKDQLRKIRIFKGQTGAGSRNV